MGLEFVNLHGPKAKASLRAQYGQNQVNGFAAWLQIPLNIFIGGFDYLYLNYVKGRRVELQEPYTVEDTYS